MSQHHTHPALDNLLSINRNHPKLWVIADEIRSLASKQIGWEDWCYMPMSGWYAALCKLQGVTELTHPAQFHILSVISAVGAWRMTQGIYRVDPALYDPLLKSEFSGDIPSDVLYQIPEWCVFIETPGIQLNGDPVTGAWVHLEADQASGKTELRIVTLGERTIMPFVLNVGNWTIEEAITRAIQEDTQSGNAAHGDRIRQVVQPVLSLLLYICTHNAEITGKHGRPGNPQPKRTKHEEARIYPANGPRIWDVGMRTNADLDIAYH